MSEAVTHGFQDALDSTYELLEPVFGCVGNLLLYAGIALGACIVAALGVSVVAITAFLVGGLGYEVFRCFLGVRREWGEWRRGRRGGGRDDEDGDEDEDLEMGGLEKVGDAEVVEIERREMEMESEVDDDDAGAGVGQEQEMRLLGTGHSHGRVVDEEASLSSGLKHCV